jgi:hypothetical protein
MHSFPERTLPHCFLGLSRVHGVKERMVDCKVPDATIQSYLLVEGDLEDTTKLQVHISFTELLRL